jgi:5-dehydro-2-deoxygluconokinase
MDVLTPPGVAGQTEGLASRARDHADPGDSVRSPSWSWAGGPGPVVVIGRVGVDLPPREVETSLDDVSGFGRAVGGFGGNVSTALSRLRIPVRLVASVGDDGHGRYIRSFLAHEGVDVTSISTVAGTRTAIAFFEVWPPEDFPVTFYPSLSYWATRRIDLPMDALQDARALVVSGTAFARKPGRTAARAAMAIAHRHGRPIVLDLDWRAALWSSAGQYEEILNSIAPDADVVVGGQAEFEAAGLRPEKVAQQVKALVLKLGSDGVVVLEGTTRADVPGIDVRTLCGLGSGDAFLGAFVAGLVEGRSVIAAAMRGNAAGAIVATRLACSSAMPSSSEIDQLLEDSGRTHDQGHQATASPIVSKAGRRI